MSKENLSASNTVVAHTKRKLWNLDSDFISAPIFQNTLPGAPSGPFFKSVPIDSFEKFATYHVSSLEKSYAWQPHFTEAGVKIDLVDQESFLIPNNVPALEPMDLKYIQASNDLNNRSKQRRAMLVKEDSEKPWWLRNTVYLENNLYKQQYNTNKKSLDALSENININTTEGPFSVKSIEESFEQIKNLDKILVKARKEKLGKKGPDVKMEWSVSIFPETSFYQNPLLPIRFDEDIQELVTKKNDSENLEMDVLCSIITNLRERTTSIENLKMNDKCFNASLIAPSMISPREVSNEGVPYTWVADFKMDFSTVAQTGDEFLMKMDSSFVSTNTVNKIVEYWPVKTRIDMRKLPVDEWVPHEAKIFRRKEEVTVDEKNEKLKQTNIQQEDENDNKIDSEEN